MQECPNTFTVNSTTTADGGGFNDGSSASPLDSRLDSHSANGISSIPDPVFPRPEPGQPEDSYGDPLLGRRTDSSLLLREKSLRATPCACSLYLPCLPRSSSTLKRIV